MIYRGNDAESLRFWAGVEKVAKAVRSWDPPRKAAARIAITPAAEKRAERTKDRSTS